MPILLKESLNWLTEFCYFLANILGNVERFSERNKVSDGTNTANIFVIPDIDFAIAQLG